MGVQQETTHEVSIATMTFDVGWPWTVIYLGHWIFTSKSRKRCWTHRTSARKPTMGFRLVLWTSTTNDLEPSLFKVVRIWHLLFWKRRQARKWDQWKLTAWLGNHSFTIYWQYDLWPWLTLNRPRSQSFHFKYLEYKVFAHKVGTCISITNMRSV